MRRVGFDSINMLSVLEKAVWQSGYRESAIIRVKLCQSTTTKSCNMGTFIENRVMGTIKTLWHFLIGFHSHLILRK